MKRFLSILLLLALLVPLVAFDSAPARTREHEAENKVRAEAPTEAATEASTEAPEDALKKVLTEAPTEDEPMTTKKRISEMNDRELVRFLEEYVPEYKYDSENREWIFKFFKGNVALFDSDGKTPVPFNLTFYHTWADAIDKGIERYYGLAKKDHYASVSAKVAPYVPKQNEFWQTPANMGNFNCYGYAVDLRVYMQPGFADDAVINWHTVSAETLANHVKNDLQSTHLDQDCVRITTTRPSTSILSSGYKVICIRKGISSEGLPDYHLMKLTSSGWLHKPGPTAIIKHTKTLDPNTAWYSECTYDNSFWWRADMTYSGPIYYIIYKANHTQSGSATYTGNHYHSGAYHYYEKAYTCSVCGSRYGAYYTKVRCNGSPCNMPFVLPGDTNDE